jgi:hypothetical protein
MRFRAIILAASLLAGTPAMAGGQFYGAATTSDLTTATAVIMSAGSRAAAIRALRHVPSVGVINLNTGHRMGLRDDSSVPDVSEFRIAASKYAGGIAKLRAALAANPVTRKALAKRGIAIGHVVGVKIGSNGALRLYLL